jgi:hypothetical protein
LFWVIFAIVNYLHGRWRREENAPSWKTNPNCFSRNWVSISILCGTHSNKSMVNIWPNTYKQYFPVNTTIITTPNTQ